MSLRVLDLERDGAVWDAALRRLPPQLHDAYFSAGYHLVWQRRGDGLARGAVFESEDGAVLYPFLLRPLDAAPALNGAAGGGGDLWRGRFDISSAYGYGGPLAAVAGEEPPALPGDEQAPVAASFARVRLLTAFRTEFSGWCREQGVISEFIRFHPLLQTEFGLTAAGDAAGSAAGAETAPPHAGETAATTPAVEVVPANVTVWCRLSTPEAHRATLSSSTRRNLRKADRAELTFGIDTSDEAWARFVELYTETMRRREASDYYLFPPRYFDDCRELLGDAAALLTVRRPAVPVGAQAGALQAPTPIPPVIPSDGNASGGPGEIAAAAFFLRSDRAIHYHLGGSDSAALADRPNNLLFVGAMDWGAELGAKAMHLGGGFRACGEDELFRFKAGFSPLRARFHMGRCVHDQVSYDQAVSAWRAAGGEDPGGYFPAYRAPVPHAGG